MKIKTAELIGPPLDWAVASCEGFLTGGFFHYRDLPFVTLKRGALHTAECDDDGNYPEWSPSTDWAQGGPIFEREIEAHEKREDSFFCAISPAKANKLNWLWVTGPTLLVAAQRCFVACKMGDEIDVPDELVQDSQDQSAPSRPAPSFS